MLLLPSLLLLFMTGLINTSHFPCRIWMFPIQVPDFLKASSVQRCHGYNLRLLMSIWTDNRFPHVDLWQWRRCQWDCYKKASLVPWQIPKLLASCLSFWQDQKNGKYHGGKLLHGITMNMEAWDLITMIKLLDLNVSHWVWEFLLWSYWKNVLWRRSHWFSE